MYSHCRGFGPAANVHDLAGIIAFRRDVHAGEAEYGTVRVELSARYIPPEYLRVVH